MRIMKRFLTGAAGLLGSGLIRRWMGSLEYKAAHYDPSADMVSPDRTGPKIYVLWHEYLLFPLYLRGNTDTALLLSRHRGFISARSSDRARFASDHRDLSRGIS